MIQDNLPARAMVRQKVSGTKYGCVCNQGITNTWANISMADGDFVKERPFTNLQPYSTIYMWRRTA